MCVCVCVSNGYLRALQDGDVSGAVAVDTTVALTQLATPDQVGGRRSKVTSHLTTCTSPRLLSRNTHTVATLHLKLLYTHTPDCPQYSTSMHTPPPHPPPQPHPLTHLPGSHLHCPQVRSPKPEQVGDCSSCAHSINSLCNTPHCTDVYLVYPVQYQQQLTVSPVHPQSQMA